MTELILTLVADYGVWIVFFVTFASCLAVPVPSSLLMLTAGGFASAGDLSLPSVFAAAFIGAILGDNAGYWIARGLGNRLNDWLARNKNRAAMRDKSTAYMAKWGGSSVFFSCWLVAPLGPYVNYVSGMTRFSWLKFALWGMAGEVVWVGLYVGLGYVFADSLTTISSVLSNASGLVTAIAIAIGLAIWLWRASKPKNDVRTPQN